MLPFALTAEHNDASATTVRTLSCKMLINAIHIQLSRQNVATHKRRTFSIRMQILYGKCMWSLPVD